MTIAVTARRTAFSEDGMQAKLSRHHLLSLAAILSLMLLGATAVLWIRSYKTVDHFSYVRWEKFDVSHQTSISSYNGRLIFGIMHSQGTVAGRGSRDSFSPYGAFGHDSVPAGTNVVDLSENPVRYRRLLAKWSGGHGFSYFEFRRSRGWGVCAPCWAVATLFAICPLVAFVRWARRRRMKAGGLCTECGYNLTGNVSGVCPRMRLHHFNCCLHASLKISKWMSIAAKLIRLIRERPA
jgi:hypothetical protein